MQPDEARKRLSALAEETNSVIPLSDFLSWKSRCLTVLRVTFGASADLVREFETAANVVDMGYHVSGDNFIDHWAGDAMRRGKGILDAAIYALETMEVQSPLDEMFIDPGLWAHVQGLVSSEDWGKIPAAVAIYVEHSVRRWGGEPEARNGGALVGKDLYARLMGTEGELRLGRQASEWEGWRSLGTGLAQAIGNVDRHRIQHRPDVKRYAMGVLGLGSLLLTQLRREYEDVIAEVEESSAEA